MDWERPRCRTEEREARIDEFLRELPLLGGEVLRTSGLKVAERGPGEDRRPKPRRCAAGDAPETDGIRWCGSAEGSRTGANERREMLRVKPKAVRDAGLEDRL